MLRLAVCVLAAALACVEPTPSQSVLTLHVTDGAGDTLPGAEVRVTASSGGRPRMCAQTDHEGVATIEGLPDGVPLDFRVDFPGYAQLRIEGVALQGSRMLQVELTEEQVERVYLRCFGPMVDLDSVGHRTSLSGEFLADLPGGRSSARITPPPRRPRCR
jgi:Carboxypeptidase regulatory-like domain